MLDCMIAKSRLRALTAAVTLLARCGKDILLTSTADGLTLSSISPASTSFMRIRFTSSFFLHCNPQLTATKSHKNPDPVAFLCKCSVKSFHAILKRQRDTVLNLRLYSEGSEVSADDSSDTDDGSESNPIGSRMCLVFEYNCMEKITVVHKLGVQDLAEQTIVPVDFTDGSSMTLRCGDLLNLINHFSEKTEVAMTFDEENVALESVGKDIGEDVSFVQSKATLDVADFVTYDFKTDRVLAASVDSDEDGDGHGDGLNPHAYPSDVNAQTALVFSLKELKGLIIFCQFASASHYSGNQDDDFSASLLNTSKGDFPLNVAWLWGGRPIRFTARSETAFMGELGEGEAMWTAELTVATLAKATTGERGEEKN